MGIAPNLYILNNLRPIGVTEMERLVSVCLIRAADKTIPRPTRLEYAADALAYQILIDETR